MTVHYSLRWHNTILITLRTTKTRSIMYIVGFFPCTERDQVIFLRIMSFLMWASVVGQAAVLAVWITSTGGWVFPLRGWFGVKHQVTFSTSTSAVTALPESSQTHPSATLNAQTWSVNCLAWLTLIFFFFFFSVRNLEEWVIFEESEFCLRKLEIKNEFVLIVRRARN